MDNMNKEKWYKQTWGIVLMLIVFFPVGVALMWRYSNWSQTVKTLVTCVASVALLYILGRVQIGLDALKG